jgi:hypothetical protein
MGIPDGAHTHGGGGGGLGTAALVLVGAALAVKLAGPVAAATGEFVHVLLVVAAILAGVAAVALMGFIVYRLRRRKVHPVSLARTLPPLQVRATRPLPAQPWAIEHGGQVHIHHHWHGVSAEDVAAILARQNGQNHG